MQNKFVIAISIKFAQTNIADKTITVTIITKKTSFFAYTAY